MSLQLAKSGKHSSLSLSGNNTAGKSNKSGSNAAAASNSASSAQPAGEKKDTENIDAGSKKSSPKNDVSGKLSVGELVPTKKDDKNVQENGFTNGHNKKQEEEKKLTTTEAVAVATSTTMPATSVTVKKEVAVRGSQRNKEKQQLQQQKEEKIESPKKSDTSKADKVSVGSTPPTPLKKNEKEKDRISDEIEKKRNTVENKIETIAKKIENKSSQDSETTTAKKDDKKVEAAAAGQTAANKDEKKVVKELRGDVKVISSSSNKKLRRQSIASSQSLVATTVDEKLDDMEPLIFEGDGEPSGHPDASSTPGKVLKHRQGPLQPEQQIAEKKDETAELMITDAGEVKSSSSLSDSPPPAVSFSSITRPGRISGRKSIRRVNDISFENRYPGSYRQIPDDDRWTSSMNVTVGSEIPNETISSSFSFFGSRGKKRERTPPPRSISNVVISGQEAELSPKSPKRARLDFSGFFGIMASPMTMLRAKFSRTRIQSSSTPNCKSLDEEIVGGGGGDTEKETPAKGDDVENVSGVIIAEEITTVELAPETKNNDIVDISTVQGEEDTNMQQLAEGESNSEDDSDEDNQDGDEIMMEKGLKTESNEQSVNNKRKMCNVM